MNVVLAMTAIRLGGSLTNHVEVKELLKTTNSNGKEQICGAKVCDRLTGEIFFLISKILDIFWINKGSLY